MFTSHNVLTLERHFPTKFREEKRGDSRLCGEICVDVCRSFKIKPDASLLENRLQKFLFWRNWVLHRRHAFNL